MRELDELRPLTALELLGLWRECREMEDPLERTLRCNARVLAKCCYCRGEAVYEDEEAVLADLTGREMEGLLGRLAGGRGPEVWNPSFDLERFRALGEA